MYISVPRDLTRVKSKVLFGLTKRQLICFGLAALIGIPSFFLLKRISNVSLAMLGMIIVMIPMFMFGMVEKHGQPLEIILKHIIDMKFIRPKIRIYQSDNLYSVLERNIKMYEEVEEIVHKSEKQRRK